MRTDLFMHEAEKTSAVFGRNHGLSVAFEGEQACTNGRTVYLPALNQGAEVSDELAAVMRGYIDHEAGHVRRTDFDHLKRWAQDASPLARSFQNAIEDIWLEREVRSDYPGAATNLRATATAVNQEYLDSIAEDDPRNADPRFVSPAAVTWQGRLGYGGPTCEQCLARLPDDLRRRVEDWTARIDACQSTADNCELADQLAAEASEIAEAAEESGDESSGEPGAEDAEDADDSGEAGDMDCSGGEDARSASESGDQPENGQTDMLGDYRGADEGSGGEKDSYAGRDTESDADSKADGEETAGAAGGARASAPTAEHAPYEAPEPGEIMERRLKDEGALDHSRGRYWVATTAHDKWHHRNDSEEKYAAEVYGVQMRAVAKEARNENRYQKMLLETGAAVGVMRRKLERALMARQQRDWDHGRTQGRLDSKRFAAAVSGREAVFKTRHECRDMDTAVSMLVDLSGSMTIGRARVATQAVVAMCEALARPGIPFEVLGFNNMSSFNIEMDSEGFRMKDAEGFRMNKILNAARKHGVGRTEPLDMYVFKAFAERLMETRPMLASIDRFAGGNNTDGEAVWKAYQRLRERPEKRKVMIIFSDGQPEALGDKATQRQYLRQVVRDIDGDEGVDCVGIGIGDDAVKDYYEKHVVVRTVKDLAGESMGQLAELLMGERTVMEAS